MERDIGGYLAGGGGKSGLTGEVAASGKGALTLERSIRGPGAGPGNWLKLMLPLTVLLIVLLLYWNTQSFTKTAIVLLAAPFSAVGAIWLLAGLGYHMSVAVWVGLIALVGVDAETGVSLVLLYLDLAYEERKRAGRMQSRGDLDDAIVDGAARRIRPKVMTVAAMIAGLAPLMWSTGDGADVIKAHRRPLDWRHRYLVHSGTGHLPRVVRPLEVPDRGAR